MSAIYGIINKDGRPVDPKQVQKMKQAMFHRAKDGSNELICDNAAFGFCHLLVYPNQENEQLPIIDGDLIFTANAHLHNRDELLTKLELNKLRYATTTDSYLILEAYKKWGQDCVHHLDGEYMYAIWNKVSKELFISNDHIGFKALYYYDTPQQFIFCSEIKGIEAVKASPNYFDDESIMEYLNKQGKPDCTYNKEIKRFCGGNILMFTQSRTISIKKYWTFQTGKYRFSNPQQIFDCVQEIIIRAVTNRINIDVPIGTTLSGGLDSSSIACILSGILKKHNKPLYTFSSVASEKFKHQVEDERKYIDIIRKHCDNIIPTFVSAEGKGPLEGVEAAMDIDESIPNYFFYMDHELMRAAEHKRVSIMYSGFGGDFWVSAKGNEILSQLIKQFHWLTAYRTACKMSKVQQKSLIEVLKFDVLSRTFLGKQFLSFKNFNFDRVLRKEIVRRFKFRDFESRKVLMSELVMNGKIGDWVSFFDTRHAFFGLNVATPLFDRHLMEYMYDIPENMYVHNGYKRSIMRHAMEGILPKEIQWRQTKTAYVVDSAFRIHEQLPQVENKKCSLSDVFRIKRADHLLSQVMNSVPSAHQMRYNRACQIVTTELIKKKLKKKYYIIP